MLFRAFSLPMAGFFAWAAAMQLNDPDPLRWFCMYGAASVLALRAVLGRPQRWLARGLALVSLGWALAIVPELWGRWAPRDLGAHMSAAHAEVEYGREFVGLLIIAVYGLLEARQAGKRSEPTKPK